jgi:LysR family transcriptional regulator, benzoate and cis,cis-muconate-responsive activator of ben and cat genes
MPLPECSDNNSVAAEDVFTALAVTMISDTVCVLPESVAQLNWPELRIGLIENQQALTPVNCIFLAKGRPPVVDAFLEAISS